MDNSKKNVFSSSNYRRSRRAYTLECAFEYFVAILVSDTVLPYLLSYIGMPDALTGITTSIISLSFLFQILAVAITQRVRNIKRFATLFHCLGQLFFMAIYLVPFLSVRVEHQHALVILCLIVAYFGNYLVTNIVYKWGNSFVEPHRRGSFCATKEIISLLSGMVVSLGIGFAMDAFERAGKTELSFLCVAIGILVFVVCDFVCLMLIKNERREETVAAPRLPAREVFANTVGNRSFRNVIVLEALWRCAVYSTVGFLGSYRLKELAFTMGAIQIVSVVACLGRAIFSRPIGVYADRTSYASGAKLGFSIAAVGFALNVFSMPETRFLIIAFTVLYNISLAGISASMVNMTYSYVDSKYFVQASAIKNSIGGVIGFLASLGAGRLLSFVQENGNVIFGMRIFGQQLLSLISLLLVVAALLFTHFVIQKQKVMIQ